MEAVKTIDRSVRTSSGSVVGSIRTNSGRQSSLKLSIAALVICALALPTGTLFGVPFKHIAYLSCLFTLLARWVGERHVLDRRIVTLFVLVSAFVAFYMLIGALNSMTSFRHVLSEGVAVYTAITIVLILLAARSMGAVSDEELVSYVFYGALLFATWKVIVVLLLVFGVVSYADVYAFMLEYVGYRPVTSGIFGGLVRFNLIIYDFVVAVLLYLVPGVPRAFVGVPKWLRVVFVFVGLASLVFAFSRLLFALVAVLWTYLFIYQLHFTKKLIVVFAASLVVASSGSWISGAYDQRFSDIQSSRSDDIRTEQVVALLDEWAESPLIGGGFGSYAASYIRDPAAPFSYEVQWVGFMAKLGSLGVSVLVGCVVLLFYSVLAGPRTRDHYVLAFSLFVFILGGFTNQYLVSSASGVFYGLNVFISSILRRFAGVNEIARDGKEGA